MSRYSVEIRDKFDTLINWFETDSFAKVFVEVRHQLTKGGSAKIFDTLNFEEYRVNSDNIHELVEA